MQSGFDINQLVLEAQKRWLKPVEVLFILQNHEKYKIYQVTPQKPPSGSLFLFNKRVLRFFRKDGHNWRKKKDGRTVREAHERLKVGNAEALNCYYAHGEENPNFQRRSFWMLDPAYEHIVLVHYREVANGRLSSGSTSEASPGPSLMFGQSPSTYAGQHSSSTALSNFHGSYQDHCSPGSAEISSNAVGAKEIDFNGSNGAGRLAMSSENEVIHALRRLEVQLSLDDDDVVEYAPVDDQDNNKDEDGVPDDQCFSGSAGVQSNASGNEYQQRTPDGAYRDENGEYLSWNEVLDLPDCPIHAVSFGDELHIPNSNGNELYLYESPSELETSQSQCFGANIGLNSTAFDLIAPTNSSMVYTATPDMSTLLPEPSIQASSSSITANKLKFVIREISPEWGFTNDSTKVMVIGSFVCDPSECTWYCMFDDIEVPLHIIQNGVLCCEAPPHSSGNVTLCITSGNQESCSEIREFEYHDKHSTCPHCDKPERDTTNSTEELLLLVRFVQVLLSSDESGFGYSINKKNDEDSWDQIIEALFVGDGTSTGTLDWVMQRLLKDKLQQWLSSKSLEGDQQECSLSKKEQGIIHMIAGLGYEWALEPILGCGVGINFRDINGWTALHWAARFGREKMVAALIASGASPLAVTDPSSHDPIGRTPAHIAAVSGHKGLAGYLSELALTSHLSSLTLDVVDLDVVELSKGTADEDAELAVNHISQESVNSTEDQVSLKQTLAAVRNAGQAAARIQAAFRAHSFRKRQQQAVTSATVFDLDEYGLSPTDIQGLSAASKLMHHHNNAALSIQKNYRGWTSRKNFLAMRQKVVKIQAHVRGYQVRKKYKVICWAVGILDKVVLRWRRKGAGLRGFKPESESSDDDEDDNFVKIFRKEKVDVAIDEAYSRVLSMVGSPEARQQYQRMLAKYQEAKARVEGQTSQSALASQGISNMDFDEILQFL